MRVLIVEDEAKTADYLNRGLSEQGSPWTWRTTASTVATWRSMASTT